MDTLDAAIEEPVSTRRHLRLRVSGVVQGVGFRPFVYGLAQALGLAGHVLNDSHGVEIDIEGEDGSIERFLRELKTSPPPLAVIKEIAREELPPEGKRAFEIRTSRTYKGRAVLISPDYATCTECLRELFDPNDRRYRYPFINCTHCGPRYTITQSVPYDRARTTMAAFAMCERCRSEYENPLDRRFHAEPTCCPSCGPQVRLLDAALEVVNSSDPLRTAAELLAEGRILAIKGLGGFHLACDASDDEAVGRLRARKAREEKPLAVMVADLARARAIAHLTDEEERVLSGRERPILLARKRSDHALSHLVAPKSSSFGLMLPYTPLHHLLMGGSYPALVMTSGNVTDEPIAHRNDDALRRLSGIADFFLLHDREIHIRTDDSVVRVVAGSPRFLRRSRGYAPFPVELPFKAEKREILAVGPELKNTVCLTRGKFAFLSHHIGDLKTSAAYGAFLQAAEHLTDLLEVSPGVVACDLHPDYLSTKYARERGLPVIPVQHHHAHIASVLAEKGTTERVLGVAFDGLGWGEDGEVWGGEFLVCDLNSYARAGHLEYLPLPGGDATTKRPCRMAYVYLRAAYGEHAPNIARELLPISDAEMRVLDRMIEREFNTPLTSSAGRLFDAAASILGVCHENRYEGQAPAELEGVCASGEDGSYPARIEYTGAGGAFVVRSSDVVRAMTEDLRSGAPREVCAARFHNSVARFIADGCAALREKEGISTVALSGGVFANAYLVETLVGLLEREGFEVLLNSLVPAGDGGVSLGQAAIAARRLACA